MEGTNCQLYTRTEMKTSGPLWSNLNHTTCEIYLQIIHIFHMFTFFIVNLFCTIKLTRSENMTENCFFNVVLFIFFLLHVFVHVCLLSMRVYRYVRMRPLAEFGLFKIFQQGCYWSFSPLLIALLAALPSSVSPLSFVSVCEYEVFWW